MHQINTDFGPIEPVAAVRGEIMSRQKQLQDAEPENGSCVGCWPVQEEAVQQEMYTQFFGDSEVFNATGRVQLAHQSAAPRPHHVWTVQRSLEEQTARTQSTDDLATEIKSYSQAMTLLLQAMFRSIAGDAAGAQHALSNVKWICDELSDDQAAGESPAVRVQDSRLTPREIEVLQVVAEGCTDIEVGDRLYISPRTVSQHLCSIYNKLDVRSRGLAIRYAVESGLV